MANPEVRSDRKAIKDILENDRRDVKDLWIDATREYKSILGPEAQDLNKKFRDVDDMINFGNDQTNVFSKWRHNDSKLDKIRSLFRSNIDLIGVGTQKIMAAATPAFPPASIISTALTFVLAGCKSVSADFDVVTAFFEEMNSFLHRVKILEGRLPNLREYQACLTDVFTSLLAMCAFATKYIKNGRFKKFVVNAFLGEDGDLAGARGKVRKYLERLQSATELAILRNTEESRSMSIELKENSETHLSLLKGQQTMLEKVSQQQQDAQQDLAIIKKILLEQKKQELEKASSGENERAVVKVKGIRTIIPENLDNIAEMEALRVSRLTGTCEWLFEHATWQSWFESSSGSTGPPLLTLYGPPGIGKSYLALAAYDHLERLTSRGASEKTCVAAFFCQSGVSALSSFKHVIDATILQISDQNVAVHEQINAELSKDDKIDDKEYLNKLLIPIFRQGSAYNLIIIIDAVDQLKTDEDRSAITRLVQLIATQNLNIKLLTSRRVTELPVRIGEHGNLSIEFLIDKIKVLPDIKLIIEDRLNSLDSALAGVRRLHSHVKKMIATEIEAKADSILYVDIALRYLSNIGREGAVMRELRESWPNSTSSFLEQEIAQCFKRTADSFARPIRVLLAWLTFGFEQLTLDGVNTLMEIASGGQAFSIEEEIEGIYGKIIQIAATTSSVTARSAAASLDTTNPQDRSDVSMSFDDRDYTVTFRYRAMHELLSTVEQPAADRVGYCLPKSAANMTLFLLCFGLVKQKLTGPTATAENSGRLELYNYAILNCLRHWQSIDLDQQTDQEKLEVVVAFATLVGDSRYLAAQSEAMGYEFSMDSLLLTDKRSRGGPKTQKFLENWSKWKQWFSEYLNSPSRSSICTVNPAVREYWALRQDECILPLAKAHIHNWLRAKDDEESRKAYYHARQAIQMTHYQEILNPGFSEDDLKKGHPSVEQDYDKGKCEILELRRLSDHPVDSNAHWATALILNVCGFMVSDVFKEELDKSIETCDDRVQRFRNNILNAQSRQWSDDYSEAGDILLATLAQRDGVPSAMVIRALRRLIAILEFHMEYNMDPSTGEFEEYRTQTRDFHRELRTLHEGSFIPAEFLFAGFSFAQQFGTPAEVLSYFSELTLIERLTLLSEDRFDPDSRVHEYLQDAAMKEGAIDMLIGLYEEIIAALDEEGSGPVWRKYLASLHRNFKCDGEAAKVVLVVALDTSCTTRQFELFKLDAGPVAMQIVDAMSDIIYQQFRTATEPTVKHTLLEQARALLQQNLPQSVQVNRANTVPHLLVVANMVRKVGLAEEWQKCMQQAFDIAWANLNDTIEWNDHINLRHLSRILAQVPGLTRDAQIVGSAQHHLLTSESAFRMYMHLYGREDEHDAEADTRVQAWIEARPKIYVYVRDGKMRWDSKLNNWSVVSEIFPEDAASSSYPEVDFDDPEGADVDMGGGWKNHYNLVQNVEYFRLINTERGLNDEEDGDVDNDEQADDDDKENNIENQDDEEHDSHNMTEVELFHFFNETYCGFSSLSLKEIYPNWRCACCHIEIRFPHKFKSYTCLLCTDSMLCQYCHSRRLELNKGGESEGQISFCCDGGQYLKCPVAKWQGIRNGVMFIEGEEPVEWNEYMNGLKRRWDEAWVEFWRG